MEKLQRAKKDGSKFLNPVPTMVGGFRSALKILPMYFRNREESEPKEPLGPFRTDVGVYGTAPASGLRVTWFGHSGMLIEIDGMRVLLDPVWEERASPFQFFGPKRFFAPTLTLEDLPEIDVVLVSHDHYDHLGKGTIGRLARLNATARARWVTALGVGKRLRAFGVPEGRITELDWTQSVACAGAEMGVGLTITSVPARHFSGRTPFDRFTTLWGAYVLAGPKHRVFFGADSGYWEGFGEIAEAYGPFDVTMLEIGASHPMWKDIHMGPEGAVQAMKDMGDRAGLFMPIHWGLFNLALHGWRQPMERLREIKTGLRVWSPTPGVPTEVEGAMETGWWERRQ